MIDFANGKVIKLSRDKNPRTADVSRLLVPGESVIGSYTSMRDFVVFTNKRVISVNVQGLSGQKKDFTSLPYSKVSVFSVETAGMGIDDAELELYLSGVGKVHYDFSGASDILAIGQAISQYVLG